MGVRCEKVVVAKVGVTGEGEEEDEGGDGNGGRKRRGDTTEKGSEDEEYGNPENEVEGEEGIDGGTSEEGEESRVRIDRDGAEVIGEVAVEDVATGDSPREVEFTGEIDIGVGPGEPGRVEHDGGQDGVE